MLLTLKRVKEDRGISGWSLLPPSNAGNYSVVIPLLKLDPNNAPRGSPTDPGHLKKLLRTRDLRAIVSSRVAHEDTAAQTQPPDASAAQTQTVTPQTADAEMVAQPETVSASCTAAPEHRDAGEQFSSAPDVTTIIVVSEVTGLPSEEGLPGFCSSYCLVSHASPASLGAGGQQLEQALAKTKMTHGTTSPSWSGAPLALLTTAAAEGAPPTPLVLEVRTWTPRQGTSTVGRAEVALPRLGGGEEVRFIELGGGLAARLVVRSEVLAERRREDAGGGVRRDEELEEEELDACLYDGARCRMAASLLQALCRASIHVLRGGRPFMSHDVAVQSDGALPPFPPQSSSYTSSVSVSSAVDTAAPLPLCAWPLNRHDLEVAGVRAGGGFEAQHAAPADWGSTCAGSGSSITVHEVWEGRRLHYVAPGWGKGGAPLRGATELSMPERDAESGPGLLSWQPAPVLVRSRQARRMEGLVDLFTEMNARLEVLHAQADELDCELGEARATDGRIEAVLEDKRARQQLAMLDDLEGVERAAGEEMGAIQGLGMILAQVGDAATTAAMQEKGQKQAGGGVGSQGKKVRTRPWAEGGDAAELKEAAAVKRREDILRYGARREEQRRVWSTAKGCYVALEELGGGGGAGGAQFAF